MCLKAWLQFFNLHRIQIFGFFQCNYIMIKSWCQSSKNILNLHQINNTLTILGHLIWQIRNFVKILTYGFFFFHSQYFILPSKSLKPHFLEHSYCMIFFKISLLRHWCIRNIAFPSFFFASLFAFCWTSVAFLASVGTPSFTTSSTSWYLKITFIFTIHWL